MSDHKPCPFCGGEAKICKQKISLSKVEEYCVFNVYCMACKARIKAAKEYDIAWSLWDRRAGNG
ncbi:Lar family restriction alleviation protein [Aminobacterium colombiense]|uniref:Restriction alleviation protein, Lar family n=1 Tax=Aminobacterium colombiense (strain DSM 12261 / ALA-1) TaxID=572547 RepID=D5EFC1_AMICL|nr:Lar family restriction alleviation protein [Aminobacterium colombiense]ADE57253.1 hypothetical protein Amico_1129 [Aminobacterium colombiense DSM 12261]